MKELLQKIQACTTMPQLDSLRLELVQAGKESEESFRTLQQAFIKKKNQLQRVPLKDRTW
ncbi:hypothetical protein [Paenibacillus brevis]|uniref:Uncharacterized protein n=1 Tax=Paenibacillus brevis TaxID=2841508 RepID=A0ABS6FRT3_9BACL|nr:hypothetical protein [Paenibacillus brevis]MBU5672679.1 hypothetical protein [Paenibacillus brevis]